MQTVKLYAGDSSDGEPVFEEIPVVELGNSVLRVMKSPGLVLGIANGDEIVFHKETGQYDLVRRGGKVAIQLYVGSASKDDVKRFAALLEGAFSASWDGESTQQAVFSFPASLGFTAIEKALNAFVTAHPEAEWYYGNVYAEDGVTPLNWWQAD